MTLELLIFLQFVGQTIAGVCWSSSTSGRCRDLLKPSVSKEECCKIGLDSVSWSPEAATSQQLFRWVISGAGGPNTCTPCHTSCAKVKCATDRRCRMRGGQPRCICAPNCTPHNHRGELCGTDGQYYKNHCAMLKQICRNGSTIEVDYYGKCQRSCAGVQCDSGKHCLTDQNGLPHCISCQITCPAAQPGQSVCGSDGVTYASLCILRKTSCLAGKVVTTAYLGQCKTGNVRCSDVQCPSGMTCLRHHSRNTPVCTYCRGICSTATHGSEIICGSDNKTYPNWCNLRRTRCRTRLYVDTKHNGHCKAYNSRV